MQILTLNYSQLLLLFSGLKFGTLKKKFSRSIGNSLRRSDSDKPKIYYSNPEVTAPTTPQAQVSLTSYL